jgi:hypothetical protein
MYCFESAMNNHRMQQWQGDDSQEDNIFDDEVRDVLINNADRDRKQDLTLRILDDSDIL